MSAGLYLAVVGTVICALAAAGSAYSIRAMRGQAVGAALSAACLALAVVGLATVASAIVVAAGGVR